MAHTYTSSLFHCVFSTKERLRTITPGLQPRLWPFLGGIAKRKGMIPLSIGGTEDHVHLLLHIPPTLPLAKAVQLIKGGSSKWVHEAFPELKAFSWQEGYGAFSVSASNRQAVEAYIESQPEHHKRRSFKQEFIALLKKHNVPYDERWVWG